MPGRNDGGGEGEGGRSPSGRSTEVLGTDLGPQWPEGKVQAGPPERHRERFGLIYPESDRKLAGFHAGMWLSVILILTPWYSERGRESSRSWVEGRAGTQRAARQGSCQISGPQGLDRRPGPGQLRVCILLATRWRCCPSRLQMLRGVWEGTEGTGVCV